jgi:spermidine/putrescine transport system substrate-binding protein
MARHPKERRTPGTGFDRRAFLRGGMTAAAGLPLASAFLAACQSTDGGTNGASGSMTLPLARPDAPVTLPMPPGNPPIASGLPNEEGATLKLYNWDQYIQRKVVEDFGKKFKCKVEISTFNNMDEALSKIRGGQVDFDVFFPTPDILGKMALTELVQPLNHDYLPNLSKNIWPELSAADKPYYDVGSQYTVPYMVYRTGIGWRNDLVDEADWPTNLDNPYEALWNPKYKGKIGIYDDYREGLVLGLLRNGVTDVNTGDEAELAAARDALLEMADTVNVALDINGAYEDLPKGIFVLHQAWSGDIIASPWYGKGSFKETAPLMSYWWPEDGKGVIGNDTMTVLKNAKNPVLAHQFLNYVMDFDVSMQNMGWVGYQPPQNDAPPEAFKDPNFKYAWIVPENLNNCVVMKEDFDTGFIECELDPKVDMIWHSNWEQVNAGV